MGRTALEQFLLHSGGHQEPAVLWVPKQSIAWLCLLFGQFGPEPWLSACGAEVWHFSSTA